MRLSLEVVTPPPVEPLSLADAKAHLRIEPAVTDDDALIGALIRSAREACESFTNRALVERGLALTLDAWPAKRDAPVDEGWREGTCSAGNGRWLSLPRPPLRSVTEVRLYDEADGVTVWPAARYFVDTASEPGRLVARSGVSWPIAGRAANGIEIRYLAGYAPDDSGSPTDYVGAIPAALIDGIKRLVAQLYEQRGDELSAAVTASGAALLWNSYRVRRL